MSDNETEEFDLDEVRRKPAYRAAIWLARLAVLPTLAFVYAVFTGRREWPVGAFWLVGIIAVIAGLVLLVKAGIPFVRQGTSWRVGDRKIQSQVTKDFFRLR